MHSLAQLSRRMLFTYLVALISAAIVLDVTLLRPGQLAYVARLQSMAIGGFRQYLELQSEALLSITEDYAYWDDTFVYVQSQDPSYLSSNFDHDTLGTLKIHAMLISDRHHQTIANKAKDPDTNEPLPFEQLIPVHFFRPESQLTDERQTGWFHTERGTFLVTVAPILPSDESGEPAGFLYFFRYFPDHRLTELGQYQGLLVTPSHFTRAPLDAAPLLAKEPAGFSIADRHIRYLQALDETPSVLLTIEHLTQTVPPRITWQLLLTLACMSLFPFIGMLLYRRLLIQPIVITIAQIGQRDSEGNPLPIQQKNTTQDMQLLVDSYNELVQSVQRDQQRLQALASTDSLTGLLNRRAFDRSLLNACQRAERLRQPLCLLLIDVDYFKRYNDHYGHPAGDEVLRQLAELLRQQFARATDRVGRFGGEEFIVLLEAQPPEQVSPHLDRMRQALLELALPHHYSECAEIVTVSIGAVQFVPCPELLDQLTPEILVKQADQNLYKAKQKGRNQLCLSELHPEPVTPTEKPA